MSSLLLSTLEPNLGFIVGLTADVATTGVDLFDVLTAPPFSSISLASCMAIALALMSSKFLAGDTNISLLLIAINDAVDSSTLPFLGSSIVTIPSPAILVTATK